MEKIITKKEVMVITKKEEMVITKKEEMVITKEEEMVITKEEEMVITKEEKVITKKKEEAITKKQVARSPGLRLEAQLPAWPEASHASNVTAINRSLMIVRVWPRLSPVSM